MPYTILLVDDEPHVTEAVKRMFRKEPYIVFTARSGREALAVLAEHPVDVVVSDEQMPGMLGTDLMALIYREYPETVRIILTGHAGLDVAVRAINEGQIYRFLMKPCNEFELKIAVRQALQQKELTNKSRRLLNEVRRQKSILKRMEQDYPGISRVETNAGGTIVLDDDYDYDVDALIREMREELGEDAPPSPSRVP